MYQVNDTVAYSSQGICTVSEICKRDIGGSMVDYYVLKPVADPRSTVYVPVNNERLVCRMRTVLCSEEAKQLLDALPAAESLWVDDDNTRRERYRALLTEGAAADIAGIFKALLLRRRDLEALGRKLRSSDETFLKQTERLLCTECAEALGCAAEDVHCRLMADLL
ncbi:MAG: hypothetical protein IJC61_00950 [Oscillospiraceae bacterium]|nr:hypothetical protein [Oscillospiraceae bacterium]